MKLRKSRNKQEGKGGKRVREGMEDARQGRLLAKRESQTEHYCARKRGIRRVGEKGESRTLKRVREGG